MNEIFHRISVRRYQDAPVAREQIEQILRAAMQAPSAVNQQPWEFVVVTDKALLSQLAATSPYAGMIAEAPVCIVSCYRADCPRPEFALVDLSIAQEHIWLETDHLGLGGVWIGTAPIEERMQAVEKILDLPANVRAFALFPLGHPAEARPQADRYDPSRIQWR